MTTNIIDGDMIVRGGLVAESFDAPSQSINSAAIKTAANLDADKLESRIYSSHAQPNSAATTETRPLFVARRSGTVNSVLAGSIAKAVGAATVTVDIKKNGTSILSSVITLDSANTDRVGESGTVSVSAFVAGDWFEVVLVATAGGGTLPQGVFVSIEMDQNGS